MQLPKKHNILIKKLQPTNGCSFFQLGCFLKVYVILFNVKIKIFTNIFSQILGLRLLFLSKRAVVFDTKSINCEVTSRLLSISTCYSRRPGSLQADAFRGHSFSLLAPARGMPALSAKDGFSRPSLG